MSGRDVFKMAISSSIQDVYVVLKEAGLEMSQVDWFLLHQANARIIDSIRANFNCDKEKFPLNLDKYGNTSSASIPILLDELVRTNKIKSGDNLVLSAFGAGFVSGACVLQWN
jgi:3-oxoacyl-[acyl-carrier-protein] synthase-3